MGLISEAVGSLQYHNAEMKVDIIRSSSWAAVVCELGFLPPKIFLVVQTQRETCRVPGTERAGIVRGLVP